MLRRYELTDEEWLRIEPLLPPENTGNRLYADSDFFRKLLLCKSTLLPAPFNLLPKHILFPSPYRYSLVLIVWVKYRFPICSAPRAFSSTQEPMVLFLEIFQPNHKVIFDYLFKSSYMPV